jgi:hypothetical protein
VEEDGHGAPPNLHTLHHPSSLPRWRAPFQDGVNKGVASGVDWGSQVVAMERGWDLDWPSAG